MPLLNPMGITSGVWQSNYQQPDYRNPTVNANVASYPVGANSQNLTWPIAVYSQPGTGNPPAPVAGQLTGGPLGVSNNP
jgi:hypothetical protein